MFLKSVFGRFIGFFRPVEHAKPIDDKAEIAYLYRHWRIRVFYSMYMGYAFYYVTRKSLTFLLPMLRQEFDLTYQDIGVFTTVISATYGVSKFINGVLADRANPQMIMPIGLIITGLCNVFIGLSSYMTLFVLLWAVNGWFQGFGWPACARLLTHWYAQKERGTWWGVWNTSHNVGGTIAPVLVTIVAGYMGWRWAMIIPGIVCILVGLFLLNRLCDTPQSKGLPPIEVFKGGQDLQEQLKKDREDDEQELTTRQRLWDYVLTNPYLWLLGIAYFFVYIVRTAINDWSIIFLVEERGYDHKWAGQIMSWFEIGGFAGGLSAGILSDRLFKSKRGPINVLYMLAAGLCTLPWIILPNSSVFMDSTIIFLLGFFIFGPQMLIGVAAAELSHKKSAATATGFIGFFAYIGGMFAGMPLGSFIQTYSWVHYFELMVVCCMISSLLLLPLWAKRAHKPNTAKS